MAVVRSHQTVSICQTGNSSFGKALSLFRDAVASLGDPWIHTPNTETNFSGSFASMHLDPGGIGLVSVTPGLAERGRHEIANSTAPDGILLAHMISGEALVQQSGRDVVGASGDIIIFDCSEPVRITQRSTGLYDVLTLLIPKSKFANVKEANDLFRNRSISVGQIIRPLATCLRSITEQLMTAPSDELVALYEASTILLPAAVGHLGRAEFPEKTRLREILQFVNANLENPELSPGWVANHVGISTRHVHRQFAMMGVTFSAYVMAKRIEHVRCDLILEGNRKTPIADIVFRWGFNDLSTSLRAFKKRLGCTPREYKMRHSS